MFRKIDSEKEFEINFRLSFRTLRAFKKILQFAQQVYENISQNAGESLSKFQKNLLQIAVEKASSDYLKMIFKLLTKIFS